MAKNVIYSFTTQAMNVLADAGKTAAVGLQVYKDGQSVYGSHLANMETVGYMRNFLVFVTNGYYGSQVRGVTMNGFDHEMRGSLQTTHRPLDIGVEGRGFLIVDTSGTTDPMQPKEYGMKTTGHFQMDKDGFLHDESGSFLLGAKILPDDSVPQFSLLSHLDRVRVPLTPSVAIATTTIEMKGSLPADLVNTGDIKDNAVDIYDSLGVVHQLRLHWTKLGGPLVWRLTATDCEGTDVIKDSPTGNPWGTDDGGIIVGFDSMGKYKGFVEPDNASYTDWAKAYDEVQGSQAMLDAAAKAFQSNPLITVADLKTQLTDLKDKLYTDPKQANIKTGAEAAIAALAGTTVPDAITAATTAADTLGKDAEAKMLTLSGILVPEAPLPKLYINPWKDHSGMPDGAEPGLIDLSLSCMRVSGNEFQIQTPKQNGSGSTSFQSINISPDGYVYLDFANQPSKRTWLIPLINYTNNNGFTQDSKNVLRPTPACGDSFVLAGPTLSNLGTLRGRMVVSSNVNAPQTLLKAHEVGQASQHNATLYKMAMEVNKFLLSIFAQI